MLDISSINDKNILAVLGSFVKQTRIQQGRTQDELAAAAAISRSTLSQLEKGDSISLLNLIKILRMLDALYVLERFQSTEVLSPLKLAKGERKPRQRASSRATNPDKEDLGW